MSHTEPKENKRNNNILKVYESSYGVNTIYVAELNGVSATGITPEEAKVNLGKLLDGIRMEQLRTRPLDLFTNIDVTN